MFEAASQEKYITVYLIEIALMNASAINSFFCLLTDTKYSNNTSFGLQDFLVTS